MVSSQYRSVSCGSDEERVAENKWGTPCSTSCPSHCDKGANTQDIVDGIQFLSGASYRAGDVLSQSALDNAVQHGAVVIGVAWTGATSGHAITIHGKSGGNYLIHDPEGEDHSVSYDGVATYRPNYGGVGQWFGTVYTTSGFTTIEDLDDVAVVHTYDSNGPNDDAVGIDSQSDTTRLVSDKALSDGFGCSPKCVCHCNMDACNTCKRSYETCYERSVSTGVDCVNLCQDPPNKKYMYCSLSSADLGNGTMSV